MTSLPQRKSPRLQGYDYGSAGAYFVTICTHLRQHLFGEVVNAEIHLSPAGEIAGACWAAIPSHYPAVDLDGFVIMPNHVHAVLFLHGDAGGFKTVLGRVINAYKGAVTARIRALQGDDLVVWQGRYHDHILRDEADLARIREYVVHNPARWEADTFFSG
ncbi:MAG: hypothetical protein L6Q98_21245 [Anaerolineae bacterium]|nr:hypothetical protein [Anaerolineae bacterium]NUQ06114.1 transposase [Anaerolineae bacterium]